MSVRVHRLVKRYGERAAVDDVSFEVERGEVLGLLGFNGAGKSTTMDVLATLQTPTSGRASVAGHDVVREPLEARRRLAIVFESALPARPAWTGGEYLAFFQALRGAGPPDRATLERLDLVPLLDQATGTMSAGQRKRVEIARALAARPEVLLLDEPTKEVDMRGKRVVWDAVRAHAKAGGSVLVSTHDVLEVRELCDRVLVMREGRIVGGLEKADLAGGDPGGLEAALLALMEGRA